MNIQEFDVRLVLALVLAAIAVPFALTTWRDIQDGALTRNGTTKVGQVRSLRDVWSVARFNVSMTLGLVVMSAFYFLSWIGG
jgi:hypothetical protein